MEEVINGILIREVETKNIMTKSSLPVGGYSVNPYVGCTHACKYCYASFMKRFTGHKEEWGTFLDVKHWPEIKNPKKYAGQRVVIGSVTDGYNPQEEQFGNTRKLLEQLIGSDADILICTKSDLVVRDIDLLKKLGRVTVSWSINTLDENFKNDMDSASSIEHRISAMKQVYEAGIRTVCFVSPVFPGITDFEAIFERVKDQCDLFWLENLNLRGGFKKTIMDYIAGKYPDLVPLYDEIYNKHNRSYFEALEVKAEKMAKKYDCAFVDNEMPYGRVPQGHPVIVDYFYHEEIRGTENTGKKKSLTSSLPYSFPAGFGSGTPQQDRVCAARGRGLAPTGSCGGTTRNGKQAKAGYHHGGGTLPFDIIVYSVFVQQIERCKRGFRAFEVLMDHQSFFSAVRAKKLARTAPEMLCHTENTAPGMVASGYCAK